MLRILALATLAALLMVAPSGGLPLGGSAASALAGTQAALPVDASLEAQLAWKPPALPERDSFELSLAVGRIGLTRAERSTSVRRFDGTDLPSPRPDPYRGEVFVSAP